MTKYWAIWGKKTNMWWSVFSYDSYCREMKITRMVNNIPIWDSKERINFLIKAFHPTYWEVKESTPQDALLAKCGKMRKGKNDAKI